MNQLDVSERRDTLRWLSPAAVLILVNFVPVLGAILWDWSLLQIVALYWFENVIIGVINAVKILTCMPAQQESAAASDAPQSDGALTLVPRKGVAAEAVKPLRSSDSLVQTHLHKLFLVPFFTFHYGMFCFVHGGFVFGLLGGPGGMPAGDFPNMLEMILRVLSGGTLLAAVALIASHFYSYVFHFLIGGEFRRVTPPQLMAAPYGRIVVLHLALIFGAFAIVALGQPLILVLLLIGGKTFLDWTLHNRAHRKLAHPK